MSFFAAIFKILRLFCFLYGIFLILFKLDYNSRKKKTGTDPEPDTAFEHLFYRIYISRLRFTLALIIAVLAFSPIFQLFQNTNIGSIMEEESYEESYYVYIREDTTYAKAYKVKADIIRDYIDSSTLGFFCDESLTLEETGYFVERIYWGNGRFLTFYADKDDLDDSPARLYPGIETKVIDKNDNEYYVTLTKEKAN